MTAYEKIAKFNALIGAPSFPVTDEKFWQTISNQTSRISEELQETIDAIIDQDLLETVDGVADIMVTAIGLYQKLQLAGVHIDEALERVCDNNLTKFHSTDEDANTAVKFYQDLEIPTFVRAVTLTTGETYYGVIRKSDGKLLKPVNFEPVNLQDIVDKAYDKVDRDATE